ncbi:MAG: response regulator transcription factor, partial [Ktedonobacteraceae bacterium]
LRDALTLLKELKIKQQVEQVHTRLRSLTRPKTALASQSLPAKLTSREANVLELVAQGKSNRQIAQELGLSVKTVANHLTHIFNKTMCENRAAAAAFAIHNGLV